MKSIDFFSIAQGFYCRLKLLPEKIWLVYLTAILLSVPVQAKQMSFHKIKAPPPKAGSLFIYPERIKQPSGGFVTAQRGLIFVPLNRSKPDSDVIAVEFYRFKADESADPETPPIFYLPGGPGYEGLEGILAARPNHYRQHIKPYLAVSDLIIVTQRGIGTAKPNTTIETTVEPQPLNKPYDWRLQSERYQAALSKERDAWLELGVDLSGFNVVEAAADINDIRMALGYNKISLWGGSFGSHWAMAAMRQFPESIARAVLWGMEGPDHTYDHPGHIWNVYKRVAAQAQKSSVLAPYIPEGGLIKAVEAIVEKVDAKPFTVMVEGEKVLFDSTTIRQLTQGYSDAGLRAWPADIITMYNGDFSEAAAYILSRRSNQQRRFRTASYYMLDCGSGITNKRLLNYQSDQASNLVSKRNWIYQKGCPVWGSDLGEDFRQNFISQIPTVIVQGTYDLATPYENAIELAPFFTNATLVTVNRGPHWAVGRAMAHSSAFSRDIYGFLATGKYEQLPKQIDLPTLQWYLPDKLKLAAKN